MHGHQIILLAIYGTDLQKIEIFRVLYSRLNAQGAYSAKVQFFSPEVIPAIIKSVPTETEVSLKCYTDAERVYGYIVSRIIHTN